MLFCLKRRLVYRSTAETAETAETAFNCQKPKAYTRRDKQLLCEAFYLAESVLEEWCGAAPRRVVRCSA